MTRLSAHPLLVLEISGAAVLLLLVVTLVAVAAVRARACHPPERYARSGAQAMNSVVQKTFSTDREDRS